VRPRFKEQRAKGLERGRELSKRVRPWAKKAP